MLVTAVLTHLPLETTRMDQVSHWVNLTRALASDPTHRDTVAALSSARSMLASP